MDLRDSASALGLHNYGVDPPGGELFGRFHSIVTEWMRGWGSGPTYIGFGGAGYSDKYVKFQGQTHSKLLKSNFDNVTSLSIAANPKGSDAPAYDSFAKSFLYYSNIDASHTPHELMAAVVVNEAFVEFHSDRYESLLRSMVELCPWGFGYGFSASVESRPELYISGLANGKLSPGEYKSLCAWYAAPGAVRMTSLRDVHPYNLLNEAQLASDVREGLTLRDFIRRRPECSLERITEYGLHLWRVPVEEVALCKADLAGSPILLNGG